MRTIKNTIYKPFYKNFIRLNNNIQARLKFLFFEKKKWKDLISFENKKKNETLNFTSVAPPALSVVPQQYVVQSNTNVTFNNYITHTNFITSLKVDFDGIVTTLNGTSISQDLILPISSPGTKSISLTAFTEHWEPIVGYFP